MSARLDRTTHPSKGATPSTSRVAERARRPEVRLRALRLIVGRASTTRWSPRLLTLLLEELHVDDLFIEIVGRRSRSRIAAPPQP